MTQKFLVVILFLLVFVCTTISSPTPCAGTANVLEVLDEAEINEEQIFSTPPQECDPASTCEMRCSCGKSLYFDMTKHRNWNSASTQRIWKSICGKRQSVTHYVAAEIRGAVNRLVTKRSGFAGLITNSVEKIIMRVKISQLLGKVFNIVYTRYKQICHGKTKLSRQTLSFLTWIFKIQLATRANAFKSYQNYSKLESEARGILDRFVARINAGGFNYCNCVPFLRKTSWVKLFGANLACRRKCASGTLEFEENEALNVAADEYMDE